MTTPNNITKLKENQIFVFGSNLNGNHAGGAARLAKDSFGAQDGVGEGLTGQSYAFPTLDTKMKKVSKKALTESKTKLYKCAEENQDKQFLVTKLGCGIAGFSEGEMKKIFQGDKPKNVILPAGWAVIRGYKAFNKGLVCRGMQYEFGKDFYHEGNIELCASGFHFCKSLGNVYNYYSFGTDIDVCEIESIGDVIDEENMEKSVTNHIRLVRILNPEEAKNNSGINNSGHSNTGDRNTGDWNTGHRNTGHSNTGDRNTGDWNTGDWNTGDWNTGHRNTGDRNTGDWNTGHRNTGDRNTGDSNTGHRNTGDWNTGDWNTGDRNTGSFNTETPKDILVFNKKCSKEKWDNANKPSWLYFNLTQWVDFSDMTDYEKEQYPSCKTTGGYLKKYDYKEAFKKSFDNASKEQQQAIKKLPNWNKKVFFEISGIMID
jgi:PPE-repeat protein